MRGRRRSQVAVVGFADVDRMCVAKERKRRAAAFGGPDLHDERAAFESGGRTLGARERGDEQEHKRALLGQIAGRQLAQVAALLLL